MNDSAWERVVDAIDAKFGISGHHRRTEALEDRSDLSQKVDSIEFTRDGEDYRLVRISGPAIIDRKSHYTKTAGGGVRFENIYDESETAHKVHMYKHNGNDWEELNTSDLSILA